MKVLRIYDHLGQLKKELNIYVEGEDFTWQASSPECVWLGTITLEDAGKEPELIEAYRPVEEPITEEEAKEMQVDIAIDAMREEEMATHEEVLTIPKEEAEWLEGKEESERKQAEEVTNEPKKVHRKRSRKPGTHPSDYLKSLKVIREDDTGGDTNQGD